MQEAERDEPPLDEEPWRPPLESLERKLSELRRAVSALRDTLEESDAGAPSLRVVRGRGGDTETAPGEISIPVTSASELWGGEIGAGASKESFTAVWERIKKEAEEEHAKDASSEEEPDDAVPPADAQAVAHDEPAAEADAAAEAQPAEDDPADAKFQEVWKRLQRERGAGDDQEAPGSDEGHPKNLKAVWEKLQREREERGDDPVETPAKGALPQEYRMTIEDRDGTPIDLIALHRALRAFASPDDVDLLSHVHGAAVLSMRTTDKVDLDELGTAIGMAMSRSCEVIPQDQGKVFLRLSVEDGDEGSDG